jgi:hypothetical protein
MNDKKVEKSESDLTRAELDLWKNFYNRVDETRLARILVERMEADPDLRKKHAALYVRAFEVKKRHDSRQALAHSIGCACGRVVRFTWTLVTGSGIRLRQQLSTTAKAAEGNAHFEALATHPEIASAIVQYLDGNPDSRNEMAGLYALAQSSIKPVPLAKAA